jgi:hypothetical protein
VNRVRAGPEDVGDQTLVRGLDHFRLFNICATDKRVAPTRYYEARFLVRRPDLNDISVLRAITLPLSLRLCRSE